MVKNGLSSEKRYSDFGDGCQKKVTFDLQENENDLSKSDLKRAYEQLSAGLGHNNFMNMIDKFY